MSSNSIKYTASKAHWAGGVSGAVTAALMLGLHLTGAVELGQSDIAGAIAAIGSGVAVGLSAWLGTYRAPANQPK